MKNAKNSPKRQPPVSIPLPFGKAVEGLLRVKPKPKAEKKAAGKKKRVK